MSKDRPYQICARCVMDTSVDDIFFDEEGICNYCIEFLKLSGHILNENEVAKSRNLENLVSNIKSQGKGKKYDCIVGVSGGVDSSYVLHKVVELGLRPLAVHMDNGWNSELAQNNIANLVNGLGVDLYTHVINWDEYKSLMNAFFAADVVDVELLYDNAALGVNFKQANNFGVKWIMGGTNTSTEGMRMPQKWNWLKLDRKNIKSIAAKFGNIRLETFPALGILHFHYLTKVKGIKWISFLDNINYNKAVALDELEKKYNYKRYPYKHYESIFTRFYQGFLLPNKFGIDKRRIHLSTLIISRQITRDDAILDLKKIPYPSESELEADKKYFLKKMKWTEAQLQSYIRRPRKNHDDYPSEAKLIKIFETFRSVIKVTG